MPIDIYSVAAQLRQIELMPRIDTFLFDMFAFDGGMVEEDKAVWDFRKGAIEMAPFVHEGTGGVLMGRRGFETREISFCNIAPERAVNKSDITHRTFGEPMLGAMSAEQRQKKLLAKDQLEMLAAIQRRREWMIRQVLLTGRLDVFEYNNEGRNLATTKFADFQFTQHFVPKTKWNESGAAINDDMMEMTDIVAEGLGNADICVMDSKSYKAMRDNSDFLKELDKDGLNMGEINQKYRGNGIRLLGRNVDGIEMYVHSGKFMDDDDVMKPVMPEGTMIYGTRKVLEMKHGPVYQVETTDGPIKGYVKKEVPLKYALPGGTSFNNRITSRPTVIPTNVDAWVVAKVL